MTAILIFFFAHWYLSLFCQTFFLHRYAAHAVCTMSKGWEKFFFILTWLFQGSSYLSAYGYGVLHRIHHAYTDTEKDPHSPKYDDNLFKMMWKTKTIYSNIFYRKADVDEKFTKGVPQWNAFDNFADNWYSRIFWIIAYITFYVIFADAWWQYLLLPIHFAMGPVHSAIINWFAHKYGYTNYKVSDTSKNMLPLDILMFGESYHNNHHKHASDPNFGKKWFEIDPGYIMILIMNALGIIKLKRAS